MNRFEASDAWLMFLLWAAAEGHVVPTLIAFVMLTLYVLGLSPRHARKIDDTEGS